MYRVQDTGDSIVWYRAQGAEYRYRVQGAGVQYTGYRVQGARYMVQGHTVQDTWQVQGTRHSALYSAQCTRDMYRKQQYRAKGKRFRVQVYRVQVTGYRVQGTGYRLQVTGYRVQDTVYRVQGAGVQGTRFPGAGCRVQGTRYRVQVQVTGHRAKLPQSFIRASWSFLLGFTELVLDMSQLAAHSSVWQCSSLKPLRGFPGSTEYWVQRTGYKYRVLGTGCTVQCTGYSSCQGYVSSRWLHIHSKMAHNCTMLAQVGLRLPK